MSCDVMSFMSTPGSLVCLYSVRLQESGWSRLTVNTVPKCRVLIYYSTGRWPWTESHDLEGLRAFQRSRSQGHTTR